MTPVVRRIRLDESRRLRTLRLRALAAAPMAFGSTLAREEAFPGHVWDERATQGAAGADTVTCVAEDGDHWVGLVTGRAEGERFDLFGMFVEPEARGRGVGTALVEAVVAWARAQGAARLYLGVTSTNHTAIALYERCGFRPTGTRRPLEHAPTFTVVEMALEVVRDQ
jgi:GNAT superfamily N-acetyltransferase